MFLFYLSYKYLLHVRIISFENYRNSFLENGFGQKKFREVSQYCYLQILSMMFIDYTQLDLWIEIDRYNLF